MCVQEEGIKKKRTFGWRNKKKKDGLIEEEEEEQLPEVCRIHNTYVYVCVCVYCTYMYEHPCVYMYIYTL